MAFNPSSTIRLCNVPFDSTYKNQVYFETLSKQQSYFTTRIRKAYLNYLTVRKTLPDGSMQSSIKVDDNIDTLRSLGVNYMFYQNANHGTKIFYAFIVKLIYINEATTEIVFETDVYQTWRFERELQSSYIVRQHTETDEIGDNLVPENFAYQDYVYRRLDVENLEEWGYLVATTEQRGANGSRGKMMSGIYQGLYFYYYHNENNLNDFLDEIEDEGGDCVVFIAVIPKFCVKNHDIGATDTDRANGEGWLYYTDAPASQRLEIPMSEFEVSRNGYNPRNKKLFTSPFTKLIVTNHNGNEAEYNIEDFQVNAQNWDRPDTIVFSMKGDVSANPSVTIYPLNYKGTSENYDAGLSISGFPQCAYNSDTFKLWLAKNQYGVGLETALGVGQIIAGIVTAVGSYGTASALGVGMVASGATSIAKSMNNVYSASKEPNKSQSGSAKNNLLTAIGKNKFDFYIRTIKSEYAKMVDDYFTMFGYQINKIAVPNECARPHFTYVQTIDVNIKGGIPNDDLLKLKQIYNNGVTFWRDPSTLGQYSLSNRPT